MVCSIFSEMEMYESLQITHCWLFRYPFKKKVIIWKRNYTFKKNIKKLLSYIIFIPEKQLTNLDTEI